MNGPSPTMLLRNGTTEATDLIAAVTLELRKMFRSQPVAFYERVQLARDPKHRPFGAASSGDTLLEHDGCLRGAIRNIILSSVEGEGFEDMRLIPPTAQFLADALAKRAVGDTQ